MKRVAWLLPCLVSLILLLAPHMSAAEERVLYAFKGGADGAYPSSGMIMDAAGNLYGTTSAGGSLTNCTGQNPPGCGVVFELIRSGSAMWQEKVLYAFQGGTDGSGPSGNLLFDATGNLYGTTTNGGSGTGCLSGCGTVFKLSPGGNGSWTETVLYNFQGGTGGANPIGLTFDPAGNLYGTTTAGGTNRVGIVYQLSPPTKPAGSWTEQILYNFINDLIRPSPGLVFDTNGNLYGTYSGWYGCYFSCGAIYRLRFEQGVWKETDIFDFAGGGNGSNPMAGVIFDKQGNLYGTGAEGGNNWGIAFQLTLGHQSKGNMLYNFCSLNNCADGASPQSALVMDSTGVLYGTTSAGGACMNCYVGGVVFKLANTKLGWRETVLYKFRGSFDGGSPIGTLILDAQQNLYGATSAGGLSYGTLFEIIQ